MLQFSRLIRRIEEILLAWSILIIAGVTIANVFSRAVLGDSLAFAEEISQFLIIAVTFIGLSCAASRGRHIRMTAVYDQLPERGRKVLMVLICSSTCLLMLVLAGYALRYLRTVRFLGSVSPVLQTPLHLVYLVVPLGLVLAAIQYGLAAYRNLTSAGVYLSYEVRDEYEEAVTGEI